MKRLIKTSKLSNEMIEYIQEKMKEDSDIIKIKKILDSLSINNNLTKEQIDFILEQKDEKIINDLIVDGFKKGLTMEQVKFYVKPEFDYFQMRQMKEGFEEGLIIDQINVYAGKKVFMDSK